MLGAILGGLKLLGPILGGAAAGAGASRDNQNAAINQANRNTIDLHQLQQQALLQALGLTSNEQINLGNLDLSQRNFALNAPQTRGRQALLGSLLQNLQPVRMSGLSPQIQSKMPQISGGLSPAALGPLARQMGLLMQQNAVQGQQKGDTFAPLQRTNFMGGIMPTPQLQGLKNPGLLEKILGGLALGGSIAGGLSRGNSTTPPINPQAGIAPKSPWQNITFGQPMGGG